MKNGGKHSHRYNNLVHNINKIKHECSQFRLFVFENIWFQPLITSISKKISSSFWGHIHHQNWIHIALNGHCFQSTSDFLTTLSDCKVWISFLSTFQSSKYNCSSYWINIYKHHSIKSYINLVWIWKKKCYKKTLSVKKSFKQ